MDGLSASDVALMDRDNDGFGGGMAFGSSRCYC